MRRVSRISLTISFLLGAIGCGPRAERPAASATKTNDGPRADAIKIQVITDRAEVARVVNEVGQSEREWWTEARGELGESFWDDEAYRKYVQRPEMIVADLRQIALNEPGASADRRAVASRLLCQFGEIDGWRGLGLLLAGNPAERMVGLRSFDFWLERAIAMAGPEARKHVEPGVLQALKANDPKIREQASYASTYLGLDAAAPQTAQAAQAASPSTSGDRPDAKRTAQPPTPRERVDLAWRQRGLSATDGVRRFHQLGLVDRQSFTEKELPHARWEGDDVTQQMIFDWVLTLAAVKHEFDTETSEIPSRHDLLIHDLAAITRGRFRPAAVRQIWKPKNEDDRETPHQMEVVANGRLYRFEARNLGDWYDVPSVLAALNGVLSDSGQRERFLPLDTGDQTSAILFGDPAQIKIAASEEWIALSQDADEPRRAGQAFERKVMEKIRSMPSGPPKK